MAWLAGPSPSSGRRGGRSLRGRRRARAGPGCHATCGCESNDSAYGEPLLMAGGGSRDDRDDRDDRDTVMIAMMILDMGRRVQLWGVRYYGVRRSQYQAEVKPRPVSLPAWIR